jgi:hypothetical protein
MSIDGQIRAAGIRAASGGAGGTSGYDRERIETLKLLQKNLQDQLNADKSMSMLNPQRFRELTQRLSQIERELAQSIGLAVESGGGPAANTAADPLGIR